MKLFVKTPEDDASHLSEIQTKDNRIYLVIETGSARFRVSVLNEGILEIREVTYGSLVVQPSASNAIIVGAEF